MVLTAKQGTNFRRALDYVIPAIGRTDYVWWLSGPVPDGVPAYAVNLPAPPIEYIIRQGIFCAGVPNIMLRRVGKRVPTRGNYLWDGGMGAYTYSPHPDLQSTKGYFDGYDEPFSVARAKQLARDSRSGVLVMRGFRGGYDQGHVGIVLPSGYVLQSFPNPYGPDLNWDYTIEESHNGWYYERLVAPWNWIDYKGDEF